jgi:hypothetical protein
MPNLQVLVLSLSQPGLEPIIYHTNMWQVYIHIATFCQVVNFQQIPGKTQFGHVFFMRLTIFQIPCKAYFGHVSFKSLLNQLYVIKFVNDLWQVGRFLRVLWFPPPIKLPRYNWNIVESGLKHHKPKPEYEWNRQCEDMFPPPTKLTVTI